MQILVRDALVAMVAQVEQMVVEAVNAVVARDGAMMVRALAKRIRDNPEKVEQNVAFQSAAKQLERIGDHATNLAEQVILLVRGQDMRHQGKLED